jgi:hypothetical protein
MQSPLHSHGFADPHEPQNVGWLPLTQPARELALCIESCKQINELRGAFTFGQPTPRQLTLLTTPLCNLVERVLILKGLLRDEDRTAWPVRDLDSFNQFGRSLKRANKGPLRKIRNMRAAHADPKGIASGAVPASSAENVLAYLGDAASLLLLCLNHERVFHYYRMPEQNDENVVECFVQYPAATTFRIDANRRPCEILQAHIEADPRHAQNAVVCETITLYNNLAVCFPKLPRIGIQSYIPVFKR